MRQEFVPSLSSLMPASTETDNVLKLDGTGYVYKNLQHQERIYMTGKEEKRKTQ